MRYFFSKNITYLLTALVLTCVTGQSAAACNADLYLGSVCTTAAKECPRDFREADGRLLAIALNQALFALIGPGYGGDGKATFALPNLRDRLPIGAGPLTTEGRVSLPGGNLGGPLQTATLRFCVKVAGTWPPQD